MPVNAAQIAEGANRTLMTYAKGDPTDQFTAARPFCQWLIANKVDTVFGNGIFNEKIRLSNYSNYQNYTGSDQVTFNHKGPPKLAPFQHYEAHDGFSLDETELANNGVILTDDKEARVTEAEKIQIVDMLHDNYQTLKEGFQQNWDLEVHRDGSASALAVPGLDLIVSTTPSTTTVGGIDASLAGNAYWRNNISLNISLASAGTLTTAMETEWRKCMTYGGSAPDYIVCGSKFYDAYRTDAGLTVNRQINVPGKGGTNMDSSIQNVYFKGVLVVWDPSMDALQTADDPTIDWDKRCYFLNTKHLKLRPFKGRWMINRKPPRIYDRYVYYFALTSDYGLTTNKRNAMSVLSIA